MGAGGDIPGREKGMCKGEARKRRGGKQINRLWNEVGEDGGRLGRKSGLEGKKG